MFNSCLYKGFFATRLFASLMHTLLVNTFMDCWEVKFGRLVDTSEEDIKVIIVHPTVHFFFSFVYVMYLNIASCL